MTNVRIIYSAASYDDSLSAQSEIGATDSTSSSDNANNDDEVFELTSLDTLSIYDPENASLDQGKEESDEASSINHDDALLKRITHLRATMQLCEYCDGFGDRDDVSLRRQDFWTARYLRRLKHGGNSHVYGILGLFEYVCELKVDFSWANEAAHRRLPTKMNGQQVKGMLPPNDDSVCTSDKDCISVSSAESKAFQRSKIVEAPMNRSNSYLSWSDFERLHSHRHRIPYFTIVLFLLCTISLLASIAVNDWKLAPLADNPMLGPPAQVLIHMGALDANRMVLQGEWYRLFTAIILHAGIIHYAINMMALLLIGPAVEKEFGSLYMAAIFVVAAVGGNVASALLLASSYTISVGASGGLFALMGICLADVLANWDLITLCDPQQHEPGVSCRWVVFWLVVELSVSLLIGLTPYVDNCIHLGGFVYAIGFGIPFLNKCSSSTFFGHAEASRRQCIGRLWSLIGLLLTLTLYFGTLALSLTQATRLDDQGRPTPVCPSCRYISCVPFPFWTEHKWWYCDGCEHVGVIVYYEEKGAHVEMVCPFSGTVEAELDGVWDGMTILEELVGLCRTSCRG
ncbi:hypothetical protein MPSEU_000755400 [Mayamaea pseudoterrestris]|nr:hypothetical protein MPSEU_000755400 [Mayamaea pseudoterrestris]